MKPLFLIGYMGCGKSTLGRKLAQRLGVEFYDTDMLIEQRVGASVTDIFQYEGESHFRELEREALMSVIDRDAECVVSTGGGLPVWQDNMELMNAAGRTIYLKRSAKQIARRLSPFGRQKRPRLRGLNDEELVEFMTNNMAEREPYYLRAQTTIKCGEFADRDLIEIIFKQVNCEI